MMYKRKSNRNWRRMEPTNQEQSDTTQSAQGSLIASSPIQRKSKKLNKKIFLIPVVVIILVLVGVFLKQRAKNKEADKNRNTEQQAHKPGDPSATDPVEKGRTLSNGQCTGSGSKQLGSLPMRISDISIVVPYGLLAGAHVTPVDHQYYWGKVQMGEPDTYDVLAPADGHIVDVQYRDHHGQGKVKGDYRVVISYSCTFFSYFDLATSLDPSISSHLPKGWETSANVQHVNIAVKKGQVVGKMGGQSLDYAVWDTTKTDRGLLVPEAYNIAEPWKINTVEPLNYYTDEVKQSILPLYGRSVSPQDGVIGQDIDGKLVGGWFKEGSYGYAGASMYTGGPDYAKGHLALVHNLYDPNTFMFSIGSYASPNDAQQFAIKNPSVTPDNADTSSGTIKYELASLVYFDEKGAMWNGAAPAKTVTATAGQTRGTVLIQMLDKRKIKLEVFPDKLPADVSGFTNKAMIYTRGEDAKNSPTIKNPGGKTSTAT